MSAKKVLDLVLKNKFLIICCAVLILGTVFGTLVLKYLPEKLCGELLLLASPKADSFLTGFINRIALPLIILTSLYLSGFSAAGHATSAAAVFICGAIMGIKSAVNYLYSGTGFFLTALAEYFTFSLYVCFLLITMAESSFFSSQQIYIRAYRPSREISHTYAGNATVMYIAFTAASALFAAFSAYIFSILEL